MTIEELEKIMVEHGVVLRAIPKVVVGVYEKKHIERYPNAVVKYVEGFKREMLFVERVPQNAGKFIFELAKTDSMVRFCPKEYFVSIEEAVGALLKTKEKREL